MKFKEIEEASYSGNLGMMEMMKFYAFATPEQVRRFKQLIASKNKDDRKLANVMLQAITGADLQGEEFATENAAIKLAPKSQSAEAWIEKVYAKYPHTFQNNHVMVWGEGDEQQFAMFELEPSKSKKDAVEVKWFQAYPLRAGVGSRAMQELQRMAREDGIALTLYPWDKGQVSQSKLIKFYKGQGFKPTLKGSKNMYWSPSENS